MSLKSLTRILFPKKIPNCLAIKGVEMNTANFVQYHQFFSTSTSEVSESVESIDFFSFEKFSELFMEDFDARRKCQDR